MPLLIRVEFTGEGPVGILNKGVAVKLDSFPEIRVSKVERPNCKYLGERARNSRHFHYIEIRSLSETEYFVFEYVYRKRDGFFRRFFPGVFNR